MLVSEVLNSAARKLGLIASNETLTTYEYANALTILQSMLQSWAAERINVTASTKETFTLTSGTGSYTWGSGGDITTDSPNKLLTASILSSGTTTSLNIISEGEYESISEKTTSGKPSSIFLRYVYPLTVVYLYPVPDAADTLNLYSLKPFTETGSFAAIGDTISVPPHYLEPIIYNVAVRMATEFGVTSSQELVAVAKGSYNRIINLNASNAIEPVRLVFPS